MKTKIILVASLSIIAASLLILPISNYAFATTIEDGGFQLSPKVFGQNTKLIQSSKTVNDEQSPTSIQTKLA